MVGRALPHAVVGRARARAERGRHHAPSVAAVELSQNGQVLPLGTPAIASIIGLHGSCDLRVATIATDRLMTTIDLPHPLEAYFAHAEIASSRQGRRFTITLPYLAGDKVDRLQWWWQVSSAHERIVGEEGVVALRRQAIERFKLHVERWLNNSGNRLYDGLPFPRLMAVQSPALPADDVAKVVDLGDVRAWQPARVTAGR